ncbi:MAG: ECF transporter S component, partial [bacterium]
RITNYFFIFPMYAKMFGMSMDAIVQMVVAVNPLVHDVMGVMLCSLLPFNLFKYGMISLITFLIYKKISVILKRYTA